MCDALGRLRIDVAEIAERPVELPYPNRLRLAADRGDERLDFELSAPPLKRVDLLLHDRLDPRDLPQTRRDRAVQTRPQIVDVEKARARYVPHVALNVRGDGEVDDDERTPLPLRHRRSNRGTGDDGLLRARRGDREIGPGEGVLEVGELVRRRAEARGDLEGPLRSSVRDRELHDAAAGGGLQRLEPDSPSPHDEHPALAEIAENALRKRETHGAGGGRVRPDRRLRTCPTPRPDRGAEEKREHRAGRARGRSLPERVADLAENLGLAEHERVEPGRHATEVPCDVLARMDVEMVEQQSAVDAVLAGESADQLVARINDTVGEGRVQLDPVAGGEHSVLAHGGTALGSRAESANALAQLHRSRAMAEPETDEAVHGDTGELYSRAFSGSRVRSPCGSEPQGILPSSRESFPAERERRQNADVRALGIDVGGTFTDAVLVSDGAVTTAKVPTRRRQEESVVAAADAVGAERVDRFTHGTTMATNALLERRGARTAFVTTAGFEHLLHLRRQTRAHLYRPCNAHPPPLVPLERCAGVRGRMGPDGELEPLDLATLPELEAEAIAVCLLFSFREAEHERSVVEELRRRYPEAHVVASHEVAPEFREYERASTTVIDAYLGPLLGRYLQALSATCRGKRLREPLVMRSSGGLATLEEAAAHAAFALLSGPAAGAVGAARIAALAGFENALAFDMGGTSTDVCAIVDGEARREHERLVGGFPLHLPTLAVHTVGAGGGSIVWEDAGGALRVGPESAGADPGPACYGRGGTRPTVTDANLLLGRLPPRLPGGIELDPDAARWALGSLDPDVVIEVVNAEMVRALRVVSVEQGLDPRDFALVAFGGAGPLHACALADELGMTTVLVPAAAGVLSALGLVAADERRDAVRSYVVPLAEAGELPGEGEADLRYVGQSFELTIPLGPALAERYHAAHVERYGYADAARPLELVAVRTAEMRPAPRLTVTGPKREAHGPKVLELEGATAWVSAGWAGETDPHGTLILRRAA